MSPAPARLIHVCYHATSARDREPRYIGGTVSGNTGAEGGERYCRCAPLYHARVSQRTPFTSERVHEGQYDSRAAAACCGYDGGCQQLTEQRPENQRGADELRVDVTPQRTHVGDARARHENGAVTRQRVERNVLPVTHKRPPTRPTFATKVMERVVNVCLSLPSTHCRYVERASVRHVRVVRTDKTRQPSEAVERWQV